MFTEFFHQQIKELELYDEDTTDGGLFSICEEYFATTDDAKRLSKYDEKAMSMIDFGIVWRTILEACKVLGYPDASPCYRN